MVEITNEFVTTTNDDRRKTLETAASDIFEIFFAHHLDGNEMLGVLAASAAHLLWDARPVNQQPLTQQQKMDMFMELLRCNFVDREEEAKAHERMG